MGPSSYSFGAHRKPDGSIHLEESYWEDKIEPMSKLGIDSPGPLKYPDIDSNFKKLSKYKSYGSVRIAEGNPKSDVGRIRR
eukprot:g12187.t1